MGCFRRAFHSIQRLQFQGLRQTIPKLFTIEYAACSRFFPGFAQVIHNAAGVQKAGSGEGSPLGPLARFSASQLHRFFNAEFLSAATRALAPALRRTLLRSVLLMLALIAARISSLFLRFHRINGFRGTNVPRNRLHRPAKCPPVVRSKWLRRSPPWHSFHLRRAAAITACREPRQPLFTRTIHLDLKSRAHRDREQGSGKTQGPCRIGHLHE